MIDYHLHRFSTLLDALAGADPMLEPKRCVDLAVQLLDAAEDAVEAVEWDTPAEVAERARLAFNMAEVVAAAGVAAGVIEKARIQ